MAKLALKLNRRNAAVVVAIPCAFRASFLGEALRTLGRTDDASEYARKSHLSPRFLRR